MVSFILRLNQNICVEVFKKVNIALKKLKYLLILFPHRGEGRVLY